MHWREPRARAPHFRGRECGTADMVRPRWSSYSLGCIRAVLVSRQRVEPAGDAVRSAIAERARDRRWLETLGGELEHLRVLFRREWPHRSAVPGEGLCLRLPQDRNFAAWLLDALLQAIPRDRTFGDLELDGDPRVGPPAALAQFRDQIFLFVCQARPASHGAPLCDVPKIFGDCGNVNARHCI